MKSDKTIIRELRSLIGLMRLGILVAAVVLTAGCGGGSGDDPGSTDPGTVTPGPGPTPGPVESTTPIAFSAQQEEGQDITRAGLGAQGDTRANTPLESVVTSFKVWGYKNMSNGTPQTVFPGYTVNYVSNSANSTTTNSDGWEYVNQGQDEQTIKYWDWSVSAYRFFGLAETPTGIGNADDSRWAEGVIVLTVGDSNNERVPDSGLSDAEFNATPFYSRLWYSTGILADYPNRQFGKPVQLEFLKPISKVRFKFISADPNVTVEELMLSSPVFKSFNGLAIAVTGTFTVTYPLTAGTSEIWGVVPDFTIDDFKTPETWYAVLPVTGQGVYELTVNVNGTEKICEVPGAYMDWLPGYEYTYIFKVNEEGGVEFGGVFSAYTDWKYDVSTEENYTVYNW